MSKNPRWIIYLLIFIALLFIPRILSIHDLMLFEYGITFAIVGLGFNLLLGYTGLLSFGPSSPSLSPCFSSLCYLNSITLQEDPTDSVCPCPPCLACHSRELGGL